MWRKGSKGLTRSPKKGRKREATRTETEDQACRYFDLKEEQLQASGKAEESESFRRLQVLGISDA